MGNTFMSLETANMESYSVAIIRAAYNSEITAELAKGCQDRLHKLGCTKVDVWDVPGAYELPLAAQWTLQQGYDAAVCLGAVIRGDTAHFDYVCDSVTQGCTQLQLAANKPVIFGVLTCDTWQQALDRIGGSVGHKGVEAADTAAAMLRLRERLSA